MRIAVLMLLSSLAQADSRRLYEEKCLYCHSGNMTEKQRLRPAQWKRLVARMRSHSPLLISDREAVQIVSYLVNERKLVPPSPPRKRPVEPVTVFGPAPAPPPEPEPDPEPEQQEPQAQVVDNSDHEAEEVGPRLLAEKCSKCHTVRRVFMKLDSLEGGDAIIERMRRKTGSGISPGDAEMLHRFLRSRTSDSSGSR